MIQQFSVQGDIKQFFKVNTPTDIYIPGTPATFLFTIAKKHPSTDK